MTFGNTLRVMELACKNQKFAPIHIQVLSNITLHQLHSLLASVYGFVVEEKSYFKLEDNKSNPIVYKSVIDAIHYDGLLSTVLPGIFLEHPHPHSPQAVDRFCFTQIRSQEMWTLGLVLKSENILELIPVVDDSNEIMKISISLEKTRPASSSEIRHLSFPDYPQDLNLPLYLDYDVPADLEICISNAIYEKQSYISEEFRTFQQAQKMITAFQNANPLASICPTFNCEWIEETDESCIFCTEDFL